MKAILTMLMAGVDLHIVGIFFASLLGLSFVILFSLFRHRRAVLKKNAQSYSAIGSEFIRSSDDGGTDVIIVGAGRCWCCPCSHSWQGDTFAF